ncbi:heat shock protein 30C-like isoform X3 [Rhincodon typus]|uniref:heat shock protein 30C-like isoform X2 n=1 Tax=Rhincodon typus TaxID=259920 RepID=UPI00202ED91F|nr:heat shock protein 30C-like isoform X2 [Rhincodon typus]XP_048450713.1 heat shock protein 30C-like isoform X3 [Rhincodon typus]
MLSYRSFHPSRLCQQPVYTLGPVEHRLWEPLQCNVWKQVEEARKSMNFMNRLLEELTAEFFREVPRTQDSKSDANGEGKRQSKDKEGDGFSVSLNVQHFSPEELRVKVFGRKVLVTGKHEKKCYDGSGSYRYNYEAFRREFQLPEDVNAEALRCCLSQDGRLKVQAPSLALPAVNERTVPINITSDTTTTPRLIPDQEAKKQESGKDVGNKKDDEQMDSYDVVSVNC